MGAKIYDTKYQRNEIFVQEDKQEVRVCMKEEMYSIFCRIHNGGIGESHRGQNNTWKALSAQYCCFPQLACNAACKACSVCCSTKAIQKAPEGKPIIASRFLQRVQVILADFRN